MLKYRLLPTAAVLFGFFAPTGCDRDDSAFEGAPVARAVDVEPGTGAVAGASSAGSMMPQEQVRPGAGVSRGATGMQQRQDLPPDHPPTGAAARPAGPLPGAGSVGGSPVDPAGYGTTGPLRWQAPQGWQPQPPANAMRRAQYLIPSAQPGQEPGLLTVTFLPGDAGGAEANLQRWVSQFPGSPQVRQATRTVAGLTVHTIDIQGAYAGMGGGPAQEDQRLLGAVIPAGGGLYFFKMTGPAAVIGAQALPFDSFVASLRLGDG